MLQLFLLLLQLLLLLLLLLFLFQLLLLLLLLLLLILLTCCLPFLQKNPFFIPFPGLLPAFRPAGLPPAQPPALGVLRLRPPLLRLPPHPWLLPPRRRGLPGLRPPRPPLPAGGGGGAARDRPGSARHGLLGRRLPSPRASRLRGGVAPRHSLMSIRPVQQRGVWDVSLGHCSGHRSREVRMGTRKFLLE